MDQAFPAPTNSLNPSYSSDGTKVSLPSRGTIQAFYQLIYPRYQSQFEHELVYNLGMKLWLHKGKMTFWCRMAMIFLGLQRKLVKMKLPPPLETAKLVLLAYAIENISVVRSVFIPVPKKGNDKECSNCRTIGLISYASKVMLKILQARLQQYVNWDFQMFKLVLEQSEEPEIKLPTSAGSSVKQQSSRETSISALLTTRSLRLCGSQ